MKVGHWLMKDRQFYMFAIQKTAEFAVRDLLRFVNTKFGGKSLQAIDYMDSGEQLQLKIDIDAKQGEAVFDFTGTSPQSCVSNFLASLLTWSHIPSDIRI